MVRRNGLMMMALALMFLAACSGPDEKKARFYNKAKLLLDKGELVKAGLELKNAIQIDPKFGDAHYLLGQVELRRGNFGSAYGEFGKAVELTPQNLDAQAQLGKLLMMKGEPDKARQKAELVLKADPRHAEGLLLQAGLLLADKQWSRAASRLSEMVAQGLSRPEAYLMLAAAKNGLRDARGSEQALLDGARKNPASLEIQRSLADLYAAGGRVDEAASRIKRIMELDPANQTYTITLAGLYWDHGREADARQLLTKLAAAHPRDEELLTAVAGFYLSRRQTEAAGQLLKSGIQANPGSYRLRFALSSIYSGAGRSVEGIALLKECLALDKDPKKPLAIQTRNLLARTHFLRDESAQAEGYLAEVLKESPTNLEATYLKGRLELRKGNGAGAISAFRTLINDRPKEMEWYLLMADAHMLNKEPNLALEKLQQTEKLAPGTLPVERAFARYYVSQKSFSQGLQRLERFVANRPDDLEARIELADLYRLAGEPHKAEAEYATVKRRAPRHLLAYLRLAEMFASQGSPGRAIAELEVVQKLAPDQVQPVLLLAGLQARSGSAAKARAIYEGLLAQHSRNWVVANEYACFLSDHAASAADRERALALAREAAGQRPDDAAVQDTLGWAELQAGNAGRALPLLEKASASLPANPLISYHAGLACLKAGQKEQARSYLTKALAGGEFVASREARQALQGL